MPVPLVLVHSPLTGPTTWENVAEVIRNHGHKIAIPDLTGAVSDGPPYWSRQVDAIVAAGQSGILVGHSGAGPLLATAGAALDRVEGWPVTELASHHLAVLTDPELVVDPLLDLVGRLQR